MTTSLINPEMLQTMYQLASGTPKGALVEVGVYKGGSAGYLYRLAMHDERSLFLFDTFNGIPMKGPLDTHNVGDFSDGLSDKEIRRMYPYAIVVKGIFPRSMINTGPVSFVHADADQYQSTLDICEVFAPRMIPGGMILFDDYDCLEGCRAAVEECFPDHDILPDGRAVKRF